MPGVADIWSALYEEPCKDTHIFYNDMHVCTSAYTVTPAYYMEYARLCGAVCLALGRLGAVCECALWSTAGGLQVRGGEWVSSCLPALNI